MKGTIDKHLSECQAINPRLTYCGSSSSIFNTWNDGMTDYSHGEARRMREGIMRRIQNEGQNSERDEVRIEEKGKC